MMSEKRFLMVGIGGVYNYGCEAIVRGTAEAFHSEAPSANLVYGSLRLEDDMKRMEGCDISIVDRGWREPLKHRAVRKGLRKIGKPWYFSRDPVPPRGLYDAVLSIGGDIYNPRPDGSYPGHLMKFGDALAQKKIPYIMWGCSMGPFDSGPLATQKAFLKHIQKVPVVITREQVTIDYLKSIGYRGQLWLGADPAFLVAPDIRIKQTGTPQNRPRIAINLSPLSIITLHLKRDEVIRQQVEAIRSIVERTNASIVLVPHVVCSFIDAQDDRRYLRSIALALREQGVEVELVDRDLGFIETKKLLVECDLVIAARMHCAINALASSVPAILLSYSPKSVGVCEYVYGSKGNVFGLSEFGSDSFLRRIETMLAEKAALAEFLTKRMVDVRRDAERPVRDLMEWLAQ